MKKSKIQLITVGFLLFVFVTFASATAAPTISSISPSIANVGATNTFFVYGSGFETGAQVAIQTNQGYWTEATDETTVNSGLIRCTLTIPKDFFPTYYNVYVKNPGVPTWIEGEGGFRILTVVELAVTSPNGGESWTTGTLHPITWEGYMVEGNIKLDLYKCFSSSYGELCRYVRPIAPSVPAAQEQYYFTIPADLAGSYNILATSLTYPSIFDWSDRSFTIISPASITVTAPKAGDSWQRGTTHTVTWTYSGSPGSTVNLVLEEAGVYKGTIASGVPIGTSGKGSYPWPIVSSGTTGSDFQVRVESASQPTIKGVSNAYLTLTPAGTTSPTITVISPNGGENWPRGTTQKVKWSYTGNPGTVVNIFLFKGGTYFGTIKSNVPIGTGGTGSYSWPIASSGKTGSDFKVNVQSISQPTIQGMSNNVFTLTPAPPPTPISTPTITVTAPNGGDSWQRGTTHTVTWTFTGNPGSTVKLVLVRAGADVGTIASGVSMGTGGAGSYTWPIASSGTTGSDFQIRVESLSQPTIKDASNAYFTLTPAGTSAPTITVTAPNGGESWKRGTTHTVTWTFTGSPGSTVKLVLVKGSTDVGTIASGVSMGTGGTGSFTWPIASSGTTGSDFKLRVESLSQPTVNDASDKIFTLTP